MVLGAWGPGSLGAWGPGGLGACSLGAWEPAAWGPGLHAAFSSRLRSMCSVVLADGSPTEQGVDHRQVQKELGQVSVYLQKPVVLSPSSAKISWTVSRNICSRNHTLLYFTFQ